MGDRILHAVKLLDGSKEEWTVPLDTLREAVQRAVREVAKSPEFVSVTVVQMLAAPNQPVRFLVQFETSIMALEIGDLDDEARAALA